MDVKLALGETITPKFCAPSTAIGIDRYSMKSFDGRQVRWDSYTMVSESPAPHDRWWLVNTPGHGAQAVTETTEVPKDAEFIKELSGLVSLNSEGNADLSSEAGALATYIDQSGVLYAEEVFTGAERLVFISTPYEPVSAE